jgi:hypothetical protein
VRDVFSWPPVLDGVEEQAASARAVAVIATAAMPRRWGMEHLAFNCGGSAADELHAISMRK